jgi:hypothetical protein
VDIGNFTVEGVPEYNALSNLFWVYRGTSEALTIYRAVAVADQNLADALKDQTDSFYKHQQATEP